MEERALEGERALCEFLLLADVTACGRHVMWCHATGCFWRHNALDKVEWVNWDQPRKDKYKY